MEALNLLLGADGLSSQLTGVGRVTAEILNALRGRAEIAECRLLVGGRVLNASHAAASPAPSADRSAYRSLAARIPALHALRQRLVRVALDQAASKLSQNGRPVVYHEPNMVAKPCSVPTVVTFNDLSWTSGHSFHPADRLRWIERNLPATLRQASRFVAISKFTRDEMVRHLGLDASRIDVVPLAPSLQFQPATAAAAMAVLNRYDLQDRHYVLSISTLEPRKNFDGLLAGWRALPDRIQARYPLVISGGTGWGDVLNSPEAEQLRASGRLRLLGHVPDGDLALLCARSAVFAYVSHYEGFGLPILEAMQAGAPVVASATTATGETAGNGAILVEPADPATIAQALQTVIEDHAAADRLRAAGYARVAEFGWHATVDRLMLCWRRALVG